MSCLMNHIYDGTDQRKSPLVSLPTIKQNKKEHQKPEASRRAKQNGQLPPLNLNCPL